MTEHRCWTTCAGCEDVAGCCDEPWGQTDGAGDLDLAGRLAAIEDRMLAVEEMLEAYAKRRICAVMTDVDALERYVLKRSPTTAEVKKAGLRALGLDRG